MKVELNKKGEWEELEKDSPNGIYIDGFLKEKLDNVLKIQKKEWDAVILIDGKERSGKSILGMTCGWYLSKKKLTINNFAKGLEDAKKKIRDLPDKSVLIVDESSLVFNSKETRSKASIELQKIMDVVGQKNMIFILILPSVFDLAKPLATRRSLFLLHVFVNEKWERGGFGYYGEESKEALYVEGKKNYNKYIVNPELVGSFTNFQVPFYDEYLKLKGDTLLDILNPQSKATNKETLLQEKILKLEMALVKVVNFAAEQTPLTKSQVSRSAGFDIRRINEIETKIKVMGDTGAIPPLQNP